MSRAGGDAEKHHAEPWEDRHVVDRRRRVGRQAEPVPGRRIEERARQEVWPGDEDHRGSEDQPKRSAEEGKRQEARDDDQVEDAEEDEGCRIEPPRAERDEERGGEDDGKAPEIRTGAKALPVGEDEVDPDQRQERPGDGPGENPPAEIAGHVDGDELIGGKIPGEVVDDHRNDRDALEDVDRRRAAGYARRRRYLRLLTRFFRPLAPVTASCRAGNPARQRRRRPVDIAPERL